MKIRNNLICIVFFLFLSACYTENMGQLCVSGTIRYFDNDAQAFKPVKNALVSCLVQDPVESTASTLPRNTSGYMSQNNIETLPQTYTDNNGYYYFNLGSYQPDAVTVFLSFSNSKIEVAFQGGVWVESVSQTSSGTLPPYQIGGAFANMDFNLEGNFAAIAKIFTLGNIAADFAIQNGYTPPRCNIQYPAQDCLVNGTTVSSLEGSFYWPFQSIVINGPLSFFGHEVCVRERSVYIKREEANPKCRSTIFHEYAHFLMHAKSGSWPISSVEYVSGLAPFEHSWLDQSQEPRQAFIEGWANFYASAVESWLTNSSYPYSGNYTSDGQTYPGLFESPTNYPFTSGIQNGYNHEILVAGALFDFYDPQSSDDNLQTSFNNILNVLNDSPSTMAEYANKFARKDFLSDPQKNAGIDILENLRMNPVSSYGRVTMNVKNNFNGGNIRINDETINTNDFNGIFPKEDIWMSSQNLVAIEQTYADYQRLFYHTDLENPRDTWTTNALASHRDENWNTYAKANTFTANFDMLCRVNHTKLFVDDGIQTSTTTTNIRSDKNISLSGNDININGHKYYFSGWEDGTITNPRQEYITQHRNFNSYYKGSLISSNASAFNSTSQRKIVRSFDGVLHMVYESNHKIWYETSSDNGVTWKLMNGRKPISTDDAEAKLPSIDVVTGTSFNTWSYIVYQKQYYEDFFVIELVVYNYGGDNVQSRLLTDYRECTPIEGGYKANPVVAICTNKQGIVRDKAMIVWQEPMGLYYRFASLGTTFPYHYEWSSDDALIANSNNGFATSGRSINPSVAAWTVNPENIPELKVHLAYEEISDDDASSSIKYIPITINPDNSVIIPNPQQVSLPISAGCWDKNKMPSISIINNKPYIAWRYFHAMTLLHTAVLANRNSSGQWINYRLFQKDEEITSVHLGNIGVSNYVMTWNLDGTGNQFVTTNASSPYQTIYTANTTGTDLQVVNGNSYDDSRIFSYKSESRPYFVQLSNTISSYLPTTDPGSVLNKESEGKESERAIESREAIVNIGGATFKASLGNIGINNSAISLKKLDEDLVFNNDNIEETFQTESFEVNNRGSLTFSAGFSFLDSLKAIALLGDRSHISFSVDIVDAENNTILKNLKSKRFSKQSLKEEKLQHYRVDLRGIGDKKIRIRLTPKPDFSDSLSIEYKVLNYFSTDDILRKDGYTDISYTETINVSDYALDQNYPNPFNPSTVIRYQIPQAGKVILSVYDVLGREVATLVDEYKEQGRYEASFNAANLSSGTYIYKIQVNDYSSIRKMMLIK